MNKAFIIVSIIISFLISVDFILNSFYKISYMKKHNLIRENFNRSYEYNYLKNFHNEFINIKETGFYTDIKDQNKKEFMHWLIQNSVIPVFVHNSSGFEYIFCYQENNECNKLLENKQIIEIKKYNESLYLFKNKGFEK